MIKYGIVQVTSSGYKAPINNNQTKREAADESKTLRIKHPTCKYIVESYRA